VEQEGAFKGKRDGGKVGQLNHLGYCFEQPSS
jgi:hypothetical protein